MAGYPVQDHRRKAIAIREALKKYKFKMALISIHFLLLVLKSGILIDHIISHQVTLNG